MEEIRSITDKTELKGIAYIERLSGKCKGHCWNDSSLFFDEEVLGYFEPTIEIHAQDFDRYAFTEVSSTKCSASADALTSLNVGISAATQMLEFPQHLGFLFNGTEERFGQNFEAKAQVLAALTNKLASRLLTAQSSTYDCVTILGT